MSGFVPLADIRPNALLATGAECIPTISRGGDRLMLY